ncbi:MAG TPA: EAL domain-containing protein, partial [Methylophilus sp.]
QYNLAATFPEFPLIHAGLVNAYIGHRLCNSKNEIIGFIFLLFKQHLENSDFIISTLKIFAARAAAELERQAADERIREQASLLDKAQDAILVIGFDHQILFWNKSAERLYGWTAAEAMQHTVETLIYADTRDFNLASQFVMDHDEWTGEIHQLKKDGDMITVEGRWTLVRDATGAPQSILSINTDISARKSAQEGIQQLAFYDPLTKLPNRQLLAERLKHIIAAKARHHKMSAILFIDLDNFKALNDTLGHSIGDQLLKEVALRLSNGVRKCDTVARLGGDEFVVLITELCELDTQAQTLAMAVATKLSSVLNETYYLSGHAHHSSPSIGVTLIGEYAQDVDALLKQADLAMYQAKAAGRNTIRFYNESMQTAINNRVALEDDIRIGLANQEFLLHYQPQLNNHGQVTGAEVLIRWQSPKRGMVSPLQFIGAAEDTRLIVPLGNWVLETACHTLVAWGKHAKTQCLSLSVNVSVYQFRQKDFVQEVMHTLQKTGANPHKLKLELTESLLIENVADIIDKMKALKAIGIGFSLDDFGTGYSSLSYLKLLPLDQLKIDQSFVNDVLTDTNNATIARAIINLGQNLGLQVIAEGVETAAQRAFLLENQCYHYQGYLFGKPLPLAQFEAYLMSM